LAPGCRIEEATERQADRGNALYDKTRRCEKANCLMSNAEAELGRNLLMHIMFRLKPIQTGPWRTLPFLYLFLTKARSLTPLTQPLLRLCHGIPERDLCPVADIRRRNRDRTANGSTSSWKAPCTQVNRFPEFPVEHQNCGCYPRNHHAFRSWLRLAGVGDVETSQVALPTHRP